MKRILHVFSVLLVAATVLATVLTIPASAELKRVTVRMPDGTLQLVILDAPLNATLQDIRTLVQTGEPVAMEPVHEQSTPPPPTQPADGQTQTQTEPQPIPQNPADAPKPPAAQPPTADPGKKQADSGDPHKVKPPKPVRPKPKAKPRRGPEPPLPDNLRRPDGTPTSSNPGFVDALPGPSRATGVPNFVIRKFRVPVFLLPIYQAAGTQYGIRWEILAAINEIETDYGRNLNVSSAGALGWMQFMPSTWRTYGVDANRDGKKDPFNPVDAIFAAARYLKAAGYEHDVHGAILAYNHAEWYVDSVMLRARLISGVPADLVGSLTGLTEGRFPVAAHARYADDVTERKLKRVKAGQNAANVVASRDDRHGIDIFARKGSPVVAVNDGVVKKIGNSDTGRYVVLQDVYGNRYMYAHLGSTARYYPVPKREAAVAGRPARAIPANPRDPHPTAPASAGSQAPTVHERRPQPEPSQASSPVKDRLFAHPDHPLAREAGGMDQMLEMRITRGDYEVYKESVRPFGVGMRNMRLKRLREGSHVVGGTILGRIDRTEPGKASHVEFQIRPAGRGAPRIDPKPILDGWKLLEATAVYRASGRNVLHGRGLSVGQILMMPKPLLQRRVLADSRIDIYPCGREDVRNGQVDRRVLATLEYLAETGFRPTVTALKCGHSFLTASGHVSEHSSGNAVDIAKVNGIAILGHQEQGGITDQAVRQLMRLQGVMRPHQIISLLDFGGNTLAMGDHNDHIHIGFRPRFGENRRAGAEAMAVLKPGQWSDLLARLRRIRNPIVPTKPSRYAIPVPRRRHRRHGAHSSSAIGLAPPPRRGGLGRVADVGGPPSAPPDGKPLHPLRALQARPVASASVRTP
jgi:transglycosylase-like protein with SLT domain/peptidase M23-like protein